MIRNKVVFILGAGASKPFGLPLGHELLQIICNSLEYKPLTEFKYAGSGGSLGSMAYEAPIHDDTRSNNYLFQMLLDSGFKKNEIERFSGDLLSSQTNSVDEFLEYRTEFIEIGKRSIAYNLLKYERADNIVQSPDWYKYIWSQMICPFEDFNKNEISFITFNYDRSLEYFLITSMSALYGKSEVECFEKLKEIPIIHLHGKLGNMPWENLNSIEFGDKIKNIDVLANISKAIRIIHEDIDDDQFFNQAKELLNEANRVCLLGFGFNPKNIERLDLNNIKSTVFGTSLGLPN